jgi:RNA polymerase sigma-70 factor (ECF subfamily)
VSRRETARAHPRDPESLLRRVAHGDEAAFETLVRSFTPLVYGVALRVCEDRSLADEVAQETLLDLWRTAARYDAAKGSVPAWIVTIAHRRSVDRMRSEQARVNREMKSRALLPMIEFDEVAEAVDAEDEQARLRGCLGGLSRIQLESIHLAFFDGLTHAQISVKLQLPLGTAKARVREGLGKLKTCMGIGVSAGGGSEARA